MGRSETWKVSEQIIADFRRNGIAIPTEIMAELTSAKILISVLKADPNSADIEQRIEECLLNVESYIMSTGQMMLGIEHVNRWSRKLDEARTTTFEEEEKTILLPRFPRHEKWIRIRPSTQLSIAKLKSLVDELRLSCDVHEDFLLVHGEDAQLTEFVRNISVAFENKRALAASAIILFH